jgi:DNA-binding CsgD family transcriptional regulator
VVTVATGLCRAARDEEIRISQRVYALVEDEMETVPLGELPLEGFLRPIRAFAVQAARAAARSDQPIGVGGVGVIATHDSDPLSEREQEVAALIVRGCTNREIAQELVIAEATAVRHVANILNKLGLRSRAQVAVWAVERGLAGRSGPSSH